jgi:peptidoglycan/LPS O-acetylase OafA/YrhL
LKPDTERFRSLDGLRGLACLGVVVHHCSGCIFVAGSSLADAPHAFFYGFAGVEVFFALSGFLLALPILKRRDERTDWTAFAWRRMRRIVPPAWGAMLVFIVLGQLIQTLSIEPFASAHPINLPTSPGQALAMFLFWGKFYLNSSYWTMAVEVRWYLVLPIMIYALRRYGTARMLAGTVVVAVAYVLLKTHLGATVSVGVGPLPMYLPLFGLGVALANRIATQSLAGLKGIPIPGLRVGLVVAALLVVAFTHSNMVTPSRVLPASLLGFLLLLSAVKDPGVGALLSWRPLAWVGRMSFSFYLTHEFVINLCVAVARRFDLSMWGQVMVYFGIMPLVMLPVAWGFHLALERPFLRKKAVPRPDLPAVVVGA